MLERTEKTKLSIGTDLLIALLPVVAWSVYLFGARALVLEALCAAFATLFEFPVQFFLLGMPPRKCVSGFAALTGLIVSLLLPVSVPLWITPIAAAFAVGLRAIRVYFCHKPFNAAVGSALVLHLLFPTLMTRYTVPFAYFPAFRITLKAAMVDHYACLSPMDLLVRGKYYEDGIYAQLYGYASGAIGAVAVLCLLFGFVWLLLRRTVRLHASASYVITLLVMAAALAPKQAAMVNFAWFYVVTGAVPFIAFLALHDYASAPMRHYGTAMTLFGVLAALLTVLFRSLRLGMAGDYLALLLSNLATPWLERFTEPKRYYAPPAAPRKR